MVPRGCVLMTLMIPRETVHQQIDNLGSECNFWRTMWWIALAFAIDINVTQRKNCKGLDPPTFYLAPPSGQYVDLSTSLAYDKMPLVLITLATVLFEYVNLDNPWSCAFDEKYKVVCSSQNKFVLYQPVVEHSLVLCNVSFILSY